MGRANWAYVELHLGDDWMALAPERAIDLADVIREVAANAIQGRDEAIRAADEGVCRFAMVEDRFPRRMHNTNGWSDPCANVAGYSETATEVSPPREHPGDERH